MFGFFKKKPELEMTDIIWKNDTAKQNGILKHISTNEKFILLYYFQDTKDRMAETLHHANITYAEHAGSSEKIVFIQADHLSITYSIHERTICFLEHHPSAAVEKPVLDNLLESGIKKVLFFNYFNEPLFRYFGADRILTILEKMGLEEDQPIEHPMISQSIKNAQQKIDEKVSFTSNTKNSKDWISINLGNINPE